MLHSGSLTSRAGRHNPNSGPARPAAFFPLMSECSWSQGFRLQPPCKDPVGHQQMAVSEWRPERSLPGTAWHRAQRFQKAGLTLGAPIKFLDTLPPDKHPSVTEAVPVLLLHAEHPCISCESEVIRSQTCCTQLLMLLARARADSFASNRHLGSGRAAQASCFALGV